MMIYILLSTSYRDGMIGLQLLHEDAGYQTPH